MIDSLSIGDIAWLLVQSGSEDIERMFCFGNQELRSRARLASTLLLLVPIAYGQPSRIPRLPNGKPNLNGIWQAMNTANWDVLPHSPAPGRVTSLGAEDAMPPGTGIVEGGEIPYVPEAAKKKAENYARRATDDPELRCYLPGVPRINYMPYPFQVFQSTTSLMFAYQYAGAARPINMGKPTEAPTDSYMGWSNGHWEGDTLVIDVTGFNDKTWFDRVGDFHSDALHVIERYTLESPAVIRYAALIEDPKTFSRQWKMSFPLYRHVEKDAQLLEFKCPEFGEELIYGPLRKRPTD